MRVSDVTREESRDIHRCLPTSSTSTATQKRNFLDPWKRACSKTSRETVVVGEPRRTAFTSIDYATCKLHSETI